MSLIYLKTNTFLNSQSLALNVPLSMSLFYANLTTDRRGFHCSFFALLTWCGGLFQSQVFLSSTLLTLLCLLPSNLMAVFTKRLPTQIMSVFHSIQFRTLYLLPGALDHWSVSSLLNGIKKGNCCENPTMNLDFWAAVLFFYTTPMFVYANSFCMMGKTYNLICYINHCILRVSICECKICDDQMLSQQAKSPNVTVFLKTAGECGNWHHI